jgi:hypothetical protein
LRTGQRLMLPPPENRTRDESGYPLRPIIEMTPGIAESFFKRLTLLQAETPAVTKLNGLRKPLCGKRLRVRHHIARCRMHCRGSKSEQSTCQRRATPVMPSLCRREPWRGKINALRLKIFHGLPLIRR